MAKLVSKVYGDALYELAIEENRVDALLDEVTALKQILTENQDLLKLMNHPKIVKEEKEKIIEETFKGRASDEVTGLLKLLVEKDHSQEILKVLQYFIDAVKEYKHIGTAYVQTAVELTEAQKASVKQRLLDTTDYVDFEMDYKVDTSLIGGMVIRIGDRVVDSSIKTKLYDLSKQLLEIQVGTL